jgi:hypothetical protein
MEKRQIYTQVTPSGVWRAAPRKSSQSNSNKDMGNKL